jgi:hypothetical protein
MPATHAADYYHLLGLEHDATGTDIKHAYHRLAKSAHPDAGGSEDRMKALNAAYQVLSDPDQRQLYDLDHHRPSTAHRAATRPAAARPMPQARPRSSRPQPPPSPHPYTVYLRLRRAQARQVALLMLQRMLIASLLLNFIVVMLQPYFTLALDQLGLVRFVAFIPVYGVLLAVAYLIDPDLRLEIHDTVRSRTWRGYINFVGLMVALSLAFIPLAWLWLVVVWGM